jgi:hypothetical protein
LRGFLLRLGVDYAVENAIAAGANFFQREQAEDKGYKHNIAG